MAAVGPPEGEPQPHRGRDPPRARGQPLPLHRLPQHRQGRRGRGELLGGGDGDHRAARRSRSAPPAPQGGPRAHHRPFALRRRHHACPGCSGRRRAQPLRARADQRRSTCPRRSPWRAASRPSAVPTCLRVGGAPGLRLAGHRRHQDERALAARQGQGAPRGRRRRRRGGRDPRARQGRRRAGRGRLGAAAGRDRPARRDGGRRPARARRLRHQRVERLGVREGRLARSPQDVQALLRRPRPREGEAALPAARA